MHLKTAAIGVMYQLMISIDLNSIATLNIHGIDCQCIINGISKSEAINIWKKMLIKMNKIRTL